MCGVPAGNRSNAVARECNGKSQCSFVVSSQDGDPKPGCPKDFAVEHRCGSDPRLMHTAHPAAANENYHVELACK